MAMTGKLWLLIWLLASLPARAAIDIDLSYVNQNSAEFTRFKSFVDKAVAGNPDYGFSAADAAYMYKLTGQPQYATLAVNTVEAQVSAAETAIAGGGRPDISGDSYLEVGSGAMGRQCVSVERLGRGRSGQQLSLQLPACVDVLGPGLEQFALRDRRDVP